MEFEMKIDKFERQGQPELERKNEFTETLNSSSLQVNYDHDVLSVYSAYTTDDNEEREKKVEEDHVFSYPPFNEELLSSTSSLLTNYKLNSSILSTGNSKLRRSVRPKPTPESLLSSPPAIKFYESTLIRRRSSTKDSSTSSFRHKIKKMKPEPVVILKNENSSMMPQTNQILKLRLSGENRSKENVNEELQLPQQLSKRNNNLKVVKLMMPGEDSNLSESSSSITKPLPRLKSKPKPKPLEQTQTQIPTPSISNYSNNLPLLAPKPNSEILKVPSVLNVNTTNTPSTEIISSASSKVSKVLKVSKTSNTLVNNSSKKSLPLLHHPSPQIVNEDFCSACEGLGNFICCDGCPRSFHFTCAEPPLDPLNLPAADWFCCECEHRRNSESSITQSDVPVSKFDNLWNSLLQSTVRSNPKCFVMPRRFRYQPKEDDLIRLKNHELGPKEKLKDRLALSLSLSASSKNLNLNNNNSNNISESVGLVKDLSSSCDSLLLNDNVKIDHCGVVIKAPVITAVKASSGYCHCCGRFGITKSFELLSLTDETIPANPCFHRPIISCSICPLYWHLDCLDPPLTTFPNTKINNNTAATTGTTTTANRTSDPWTCPIHFTTEKCLALDIPTSLVQSTYLLPESAIRIQFKRKRDRIINLRDQEERIENNNNFSIESLRESEEMAQELLYSISDSVSVPESVKSMYY